MLAGGRRQRIAGDRPQRLRVNDLDVQAVGEGRGSTLLAYAHPAPTEQRDGLIDDRRVHERAVAGQADDRPLLPAQREQIARQHVLARAARDRRRRARRELGDRLVDRVGAGRHHDLARAPGAPQPAQQQRQHRFATDVGEGLARQAVEDDARLHDRDGSDGGSARRETYRR